jgi:uncharacterized protein YeaO (DUF488 family)
MVRMKRVYEAPDPEDGGRFLVDRLWPRGVKKEGAGLTGWLRDLAPSDELRRWFHHNPARWEEFRARYRRELAAPACQALLRDLAQRARTGVVTLVYAAKDEAHNNARVLSEALEELLSDPAGKGSA